MRFSLPVLFALLANWPDVLAQTPPGPHNTNPACDLESDVGPGATYYYDPNDQQNLGAFYRSTGTCDDGSFAQVELAGPSGTIQCGYANLDNAIHIVDCGIFRGLLAAGTYQIRFYTRGPEVGFAMQQFSITHTQATEEAPTPSTTITTTPTSFDSTTSTTTETITETSEQITVTSPSNTITNVIVMTLKPTKTTTTTVRTFTKTVKKRTATRKTATITAPCHKPTFYPCRTRRRHKREVELETESLHKHLDRRAPNSAGMAGGGPLTKTTTPPVVVIDETAPATTTTLTFVTDAPDETITVANATPTRTIFDGVAVTDSISTLPRKTRTKTRYRWTVTSTTTTCTLTLTRTVKTTPPCVTK